MGRGSTSLDNPAYDEHLAKNSRHKELRQRHIDRVKANKGYEGYHFGLGDKPVYTKNKEEFKRELSKRGLLMRDDVRGHLK